MFSEVTASLGKLASVYHLFFQSNPDALIIRIDSRSSASLPTVIEETSELKHLSRKQYKPLGKLSKSHSRDNIN